MIKKRVMLIICFSLLGLFVALFPAFSQDDDFPDDAFAELEEQEEAAVEEAAPAASATPARSTSASKPDKAESTDDDDEVALEALEAGGIEIIEEGEEVDTQELEVKDKDEDEIYNLRDHIFRLGIGAFTSMNGDYHSSFGWSLGLRVDYRFVYIPFGNATVSLRYHQQKTEDPLQGPVTLQTGEILPNMAYDMHVARTTFEAALGWSLLKLVYVKKMLRLGFYLGANIILSFVVDKYSVIINDYANEYSYEVKKDSDPFIPLGFEMNLGVHAEIWHGLGAFAEVSLGVNGAGKYNTNFGGWLITGGAMYRLPR